MIPARLILIGPNHSFPSAVARFGLVATYSGTMPGCQPGRSGVSETAAGLPNVPAADLGVTHG